jgi:hypothetical protein
MQLLASTSKVLQGRALLRPHHDDRKQQNKKHAAVHLIKIAAAGPSASHQPSNKCFGQAAGLIMLINTQITLCLCCCLPMFLRNAFLD